MTTLLERLGITNSSIRIISIDPKILDTIPQTPVTNSDEFKEINTKGFRLVSSNNRYQVVLTTVEPLTNGAKYQLDVYDKEKPTNDLPGSRAVPEHLLTRKTYYHEEEAKKRFSSAKAHFLRAA